MESRNCPNCGAPNDPYLNKCPYCGTSYFDLTSIDIADGKPMFLKIKVQNTIITQLVRPSPNVTIEFKTEYRTVEKDGVFTRQKDKYASCSTDIVFHTIPDEHNRIFTIEEEK